MCRFKLRSSRRASLAILAATLTTTAAGAATLHRFAITQTTGSEGAQAVLQTSATGSALQGEVSSSSANKGITLPFGVLGEYDASGAFGVGTLGVSTTGYGVGGESLSTYPSVLGFAGSNGIGVEGVSNSNSSTASPGVYGYANKFGDGGDFIASNANNYGVRGSSPGYAVVGLSEGDNGGEGFVGAPTGEGLEAFGYSGTATHPAITAYDGAGGSDLLGTFSCARSQNGCAVQESFIVQSGSANRSGNTAGYHGASDVQVSGDLYVYGRVYENCLGFPATSSTDCTDTDFGTYTNSGVTRSAGGSDVRVYAPAQSLRTVEDFGQAQLVNGRAYVSLDPAFARTTAPGAPYLVFVTTSADSRGVFVSDRTLNGFEVHENAGGRSTMTIDYRIVAKPLGDTSRRFVAVAPKPHIPGYNASYHARGYKARVPFTTAQKLVAPVSLTR
jgi:hypothetical protein